MQRTLHIDLNQWIWESNRGIEETIQALEEHGYFKVLKTANVITEDERQELIERWRKGQENEHAARLKKMPSEHPIPAPDLSTSPDKLAYPYVVVAQKQAR